MTKHPVSLFFILISWVACLLILAGCQPTSSIAARGFDYEQATTNMVNRWEAMGQAYEHLALPDSRLNTNDVSAARWAALGQAYQQVALLNDTGDVSAARWTAMGQAYEQLTMAEVQPDNMDSATARWTAMGLAYEELALLDSPDVSTARWQSMGQAYEKMALPND